MIWQRGNTLGHEHIVEAVGIVIAFHEVRHGITGGIGALAALAKTPTEFIATVFIYNTTMIALGFTRTLDVPRMTFILK